MNDVLLQKSFVILDICKDNTGNEQLIVFRMIIIALVVCKYFEVFFLMFSKIINNS